MPAECWPLQDEFVSKFRVGPALPEICQSLHESVTGSSDVFSPDDRVKLANILHRAVQHWKPGPDWCKAYDDAVLNLVCVTLKEYEERL